MFSADLGGYTAPLPDATNPPFNKVALLLHGDGTNGGQNNTFVDSSTNNFTITRTGNVAQGTFSPFSLAEGQWSNYFDGSGDYLSGSGSSAFDFGTGSFTVEAWIYLTADATADANGARKAGIFAITSVGNSGADFFTELTFSVEGNTTTTGTGLGIYKNRNTTEGIGGSSSISKNTWHHVAISKSGTDVRFFLNGTQVGSTQTSTTAWGSSTRGFKVGRLWNTQYVNDFPGYISNLRVVKGTALYTSNFTPPTSALTAISGTSLLTCQSNRFVDNSSNNFTITRNGDTKVTAFSPFAPSAAYSASTNGGNGYFDGSGDYLSAANATGLDLSSGDFTIEAWFYWNGANAGSTIVNKDGVYASSYPSYSLDLNGSGTARFGIGSGNGTSSVQNLTANISYPKCSWNHLACVKNGTTLTLYQNGINVASATQTATIINGTKAVLIGYQTGQPASAYADGYISDVRIVKGTAVYTSNFTPPTAPLTAVANTQLLLNCTNAGIIDNAGKNDIETVGNAQISTSVKKYGTGSMYFDGSGDYLRIPSNQDLNFGTGDWTIEMWVYVETRTKNYPLLIGNNRGSFTTDALALTNSNADSGTWNNRFCFAWGTSGFSSPSTGSNYLLVSNTSNSNGIWYHLAVVRNRTSIKMYRDGTQVASATVSGSAVFNWGFNGTLLGGGNWDGANGEFNGYIDDLRITKGQALYTSNFTPPTQAFSNI